MRNVRVIVAVVVVVGLGAIIWGLARRPGAGKGEVLVLCGSSMRGPLEELVQRYAKQSTDHVLLSFGGSEEVCAQLQQTQRGDLVVCHDPFMAWASERGLIERWGTVAGLNVVIIVPKGNPAQVQALDDLAKPGLRLGITDRHYSTAGQVIKALLAKSSKQKELEANIRLETRKHQELCNNLLLGSLDAAITWNAVAYLSRDRLAIVPVESSALDGITSATYKWTDLKQTRVTVGLSKYGRELEPARRFYEYATGQEAREVFSRYGFSPAPKDK